MAKKRKWKRRVKTQWDLPENIFLIVRKAKGYHRLARACGIRPTSILYWSQVPAHHLDSIYHLTGLHPVELRPDLFDPEIIAEKKAKGILQTAVEAGRRRRYKKRPTKLTKQDVSLAWLV